MAAVGTLLLVVLVEVILPLQLGASRRQARLAHFDPARLPVLARRILVRDATQVQSICLYQHTSC